MTTLLIEDYAMIGDRRSAALVGRNGSIDWLCLPDFDDPAAFAALLGGPENGYWKIAPAQTVRALERTYRPGTMVLETVFTTTGGRVKLIDAMIDDGGRRCVVRVVEGLDGSVPMYLDYVVRFDYGSVVPWVKKTAAGLSATAGSRVLVLASDVELHGEGLTTVSDFCVAQGERLTFSLSFCSSFEAPPARRSPVNALRAIEDSAAEWRAWSRSCEYGGPYRAVVERSLLTLRALTYRPTGGIVAAPTTSLPERLGGVRNWDYRFCWLRDATLTLRAFLQAGYSDSATAWRDWLIRAVAGLPGELQVVYDIHADRQLHERELSWLAGYEGARPVRIGNGAFDQFQLDVYGEVIDFLYTARSHGLHASHDDWSLFRAIVGEVEQRWQMPDRGMWEVRGSGRHFTLSKVSAWAAVDRAVRAVEEFGIAGPVERWRALRDRIHRDVCLNGFDAERNTFTQAYGSRALDAGALLILHSGFLAPDDPRVSGTIAAIERHLLRDGLLYRYDEKATTDGLPAGEGAFIACSFWLVDAYTMVGRIDEARRLFERLIALCNDVGLLAEEYDPAAKRMLGNFPQAFSHVALIVSAFNLWSAEKASAPAVNEGCALTGRPISHVAGIAS